MSNPFDESDDEPFKEGLLCPNCMGEFKTINELHEHFGNSHADSNSNSHGKSGFQLKELFSKTKRKILKNDFDSVQYDDDTPNVNSNASLSFVSLWRKQMQIGQTRQHFDYFKRIRDSRIERYVIETNKLLIRLDKLISDAPSDPEKRKLHEKSIVQWAHDPDVKLCPNCAKSFNLSRRRHHCRLCGGIMCHNCSQFLDFDYARKLISPANLESSEIMQSLLPRPSLTRRGSSSSLLSVMSPSGDPHIRVCKDCKELLDRRDQQIEDKLGKPILYQMYDRMRKDMTEAEKLTPLYIQMSLSLSTGEANYNLHDAQELRVKLMKLAESVDTISKKILNHGTQETSSPQTPHQKQLQLQNTIRTATTLFLKDTMLGLPSLPTHEEVKQLQEQRRQEIQRKIEMEKKSALEFQIKASSSSNNKNSLYYNSFDNNIDTIVSPDTGWGPEFSRHSDSTEDPMLQQINIIRNYIKQARDAHKYDEVHMLEQNLKELEIEYIMQKDSDAA